MSTSMLDCNLAKPLKPLKKKVRRAEKRRISDNKVSDYVEDSVKLKVRMRSSERMKRCDQKESIKSIKRFK